MESVPITTKVVSSNPTHVQVYSIKNYVIKLVGVEGRFISLSIPVSSTTKDVSRNITEILLKVALSTITITFFIIRNYFSSISVKPVLRGHLWDKEKVAS
jgi:hypothetical protein